MHGRFAVQLWGDVDRDSFPVEEAWAVRAAEARRQVTTLIDLMRAGEPLVIFPEGKPSPDGAVGPLQAGIRLLVRRGRPERISPWAIAYDPLAPGRMRAVVSLRPQVAPRLEDADEQVLSELKLAMPVTCASAVAHALVTGADPAGVLESAVEVAQEEGRHVERALQTAEGRRARLAECLRGGYDEAGSAADSPGPRVRERARAIASSSQGASSRRKCGSTACGSGDSR